MFPLYGSQDPVVYSLAKMAHATQGLFGAVQRAEFITVRIAYIR